MWIPVFDIFLRMTGYEMGPRSTQTPNTQGAVSHVWSDSETCLTYQLDMTKTLRFFSGATKTEIRIQIHFIQ